MKRRTVFTTLAALPLLTLTVACTGQDAQTTSPTQTRPAPAQAAGDFTGGWVGKTAPGFSLPDADGKTVDVGKVFGAKPVLLVFYRGVW